MGQSAVVAKWTDACGAYSKAAQSSAFACRHIAHWRTLRPWSGLSTVFNVHKLASNNGFPHHPHRDMEIIT